MRAGRRRGRRGQAVGLTVFARGRPGPGAARGPVVRGDAALLIVLCCVGWAAASLLAARGLLRRRRWARAPLVLSELLLLAVGIPLVQGGRCALGRRAARGRWSVVGCCRVLSPAVTAELDG